jgi:hypothetical protein
VSASLDFADFHLVIAGDGIRSDLHVVGDHLNAHLSRLSFLEVLLWDDEQGRMLVVPLVPFRTEVVRQRVIVDQRGAPLQLEEPVDDSADGATPRRTADPAAADRRIQDRAFWQRFIDGVRFDHPDQTAPRHGGHNWVKIDMPSQ